MIATLVVLSIGFLYTNSRLADAGVSVKDSMDALRTVVEANQRRAYDWLLGNVVELDDLLTRIENILKIQ